MLIDIVAWPSSSSLQCCHWYEENDGKLPTPRNTYLRRRLYQRAIFDERDGIDDHTPIPAYNGLKSDA